MKRFYAAENEYGTKASAGFGDQWYVLAFNNKVDRDNWVISRNTITARNIKRKHVLNYCNGNIDGLKRPDDFWGILNIGLTSKIPGCMGKVTPMNESMLEFGDIL